MSTSVMSRDKPTEASTLSHSPNLNALRHGLRAASILLPADDAAEFQHLRQDLFQTYRPRTRDEAACVEAMAAHQWRAARCRRWQAVYDAQTDALLFGAAEGLTGHVCETDPQRWMHKAMDCTLQESRLDRLLCRARDKLLLLQKLRRNNLIAGVVEQEPVYWPSGSRLEEAVRPPESGGLGANGGEWPGPASPFSDGEIGRNDERTPNPVGHPARAHVASTGRDGAACTDGARSSGPLQAPRHVEGPGNATESVGARGCAPTDERNPAPSPPPARGPVGVTSPSPAKEPGGVTSPSLARGPGGVTAPAPIPFAANFP